MEYIIEKKIYFLSDFHLGAPNYQESLIREKKVVAFLDDIKYKASELFIVGDMFDFWFEYDKVIPKGYTRLLGKLAELSDAGVPIQFFIGNHDMWMNGYFEQELNIKVYTEPTVFERGEKKLLIGHGDGLGPGDRGYKFIKKIFRNKFCKWLFGKVHPDFGIKLANYFSKKSRIKTGSSDEIFLGEANEWLIQFCNDTLIKQHYDYFIFGHRHLPLNIALKPNSYYINLGDWIRNFTYATFDGQTVELHKWEN